MIKGHEELFFEFNQGELRDDCAVTLLKALEPSSHLQESALLSTEEAKEAEAAKREHQLLQEVRNDTQDRRKSFEPLDPEDNGEKNYVSV